MRVMFLEAGDANRLVVLLDVPAWCVAAWCLAAWCVSCYDGGPLIVFILNSLVMKATEQRFKTLPKER